MRKNLFVVFISVLSVSLASAQSIQSQSTRVGFFGGPVAANMWEKVSGKTHNHDYVLGATLGVMLDVPMQKIGSFQPGIAYVGKNSKNTFTDNTGQVVNTKTTLGYLEVPMNVVFRIPSHGSGKVIIGAGAAVAVAVSGKEHALNDNRKLKFGDLTVDDYGRYDFGLNGIIGYEFANGFFLQLNYNKGINRLFVGGDPKDKLYNNYIALRAGFLLGGKKK